jgi:23S rRNA (guanosine2251-2'-O)-methyltransferase
MAGGNRRQLMKEKLAGINSIVEALKAQRKIDRILVQENRQEGKRMAELLRLARKKGIYVQVVEKSRLDKLYTASNHIGEVLDIAYIITSELKVTPKGIKNH